MASTLAKPNSAQMKTYRPRPDAPGHGRYVSKEEYWEKWYEGTVYEWNNGYLEAIPMTTPIQFGLYTWFLQLLLQFQLNVANCQIMALETGFTMIVPDPEHPATMKEVTRKPDIGAILDTNPTHWGDDHRSYHGICDLCVESISDSHKSEITRDTEIKFAEYEFSGVKEYYILDPSHRDMHFYTLNIHGNYEELKPDRNGVIRSKVLDGFQFRWTHLDSKPSLESLARDKVYQHYVLLEFQEAERRVEEERRQKEEEKAKNQRLEAKLREMGIDPSDI
ncbi:Uma2 family endonuclease [Chloroflexi bacterium TSY]|nr:Uma2 family endonuclease [Chloroflexi bacterium TSY]